MNRYSISMSLRPNGQNTLRERSLLIDQPYERAGVPTRARTGTPFPVTGYRKIDIRNLYTADHWRKRRCV
jgi:hypothetical protein